MTEVHRLTSVDPIDVEIVYNVGEINITNLDADFSHTTYIEKPRMLGVDNFTEAYLAVGPGIHMLSDSDVLRAKERSVASIAKRLPREVVRCGKLQEADSEESHPFVYFGNLAIRGRMADNDELVIGRQRFKEYHEAIEQKRRDALIAADIDKNDYSHYDHVLISTGDKLLSMDLSMPPALLALRSLMRLHDMEAHEEVRRDEFRKAVWEAMPTTERSLLGLKEADVYYTTAAPIKQMVHEIIDDLARPLGIVSRGGHTRSELPFELALHTIPNPTNYDGAAIPMVPPGELRSTLELLRAQTIDMMTDKYETESAELITLIESPSWQPQDAIDMLSLIMSVNGKLALLQLYAKEGRPQEEQSVQAEEMLENLHKRVRRVLGNSAYYSARSNRTIAGNHATGMYKVQQTGGRLEGGKTKDERLKRWAIGRLTTLKYNASM